MACLRSSWQFGKASSKPGKGATSPPAPSALCLPSDLLLWLRCYGLNETVTVR